MSNMQTFKDILNESTTKLISTEVVKKHQQLVNSIYDLFHQVYDEDDENRQNNPWLNQIYKNLSPVIKDGDDVDYLLSKFLQEKYSEVTKELERLEKVLSDAKKKLS